MRRLLATCIALLLVSQAGLSWWSWTIVEGHTLPETERSARIIGDLAGHKIAQAVGQGIPLAELVGVAPYLDEVRRANPEIAAFTLTDAAGRSLFSSGARDGEAMVDMPLANAGTLLAHLQVGVSAHAVQARISGLRYDMAIVLLISTLVAFEVLLFLGSASGIARSQTAAPKPASLQHIRMLTFTFMLAEMLLRPFMPAYGEQFATGVTTGVASGTLSPAMAASLPLSLYLLATLAAMPFAARWSDRKGRRSSYFHGAALTLCGMLLSGFAPAFAILLCGRFVTGIGYALMYMSCQGFILDRRDDGERTRGSAMFVSAIMVSEICGPAAGGILADQFGYRAVFGFSALLAICAGWMGWRLLDNRGARPAGGRQGAALPALLANRRYAALCLLSGLPAKLIYFGFVVFLAPVMLGEFGASKSEIGRYVMLYGVMVFVLGPWFARRARDQRAQAAMVIGGALVSGTGMLLVSFAPSAASVMAGVLAIGLGQALSMTPQFMLVHASVPHSESAAIGVFRSLERVGGALGPALAAFLYAHYGASGSLLVLGAISILAILLFTPLFYLRDAQQAT